MYYTNPYPAFENQIIEVDYQLLNQRINTLTHERSLSCAIALVRHPSLCLKTEAEHVKERDRWLVIKRARDIRITATISREHINSRGSDAIGAGATCCNRHSLDETDGAFQYALTIGRTTERVASDRIAMTYD
ncbi:MAG: hypothetical protein ACRCTI_20260 [Beijerinckiaceae bacterium]